MLHLCLSSTWTPVNTLLRWPLTDQTWFWKYWQMHFRPIAKCCYWSISGNTWWHSYIQDLVVQLLECKESNIRVDNEMQMLKIWNNETLFIGQRLCYLFWIYQMVLLSMLSGTTFFCAAKKKKKCSILQIAALQVYLSKCFLLKVAIKLNMKRNYRCFIPRSTLLVQPTENSGTYQPFFFFFFLSILHADYLHF